MRRLLLIAVLTLLIPVAAAPSLFAGDPMEIAVEDAVGTFIQGCEKDLTTFCKDVTLGNDRLLACLYAYQDKLSPRCEYALYDSAAQLDRALNALTYAVNECRDDLETFCADIRPGEGRLRDCLKKNEGEISDRCKTAMQDTGMK